MSQTTFCILFSSGLEDRLQKLPLEDHFMKLKNAVIPKIIIQKMPFLGFWQIEQSFLEAMQLRKGASNILHFSKSSKFTSLQSLQVFKALTYKLPARLMDHLFRCLDYTTNSSAGNYILLETIYLDKGNS